MTSHMKIPAIFYTYIHTFIHTYIHNECMSEPTEISRKKIKIERCESLKINSALWKYFNINSKYIKIFVLVFEWITNIF